MKKRRAGSMTHDYKRHGTTTLFAALGDLEGKVIGRCMQRHRHRHQEFIQFLNAIGAEVPAGKIDHVILDNYATHKHAKKRGVFRSIVDLQAAINRFVAETSDDPSAMAGFVWRGIGDPDKIIAAVKRGHQTLDSIH